MPYRLALALFCLLPALGVVPAAAAQVTETAEAMRLENGRLALALGKTTQGSIESLVDRGTGTEFIATQGRAPLFALAFSTKGQPTAPLTRVYANEAAQFRARTEIRGGTQTVVLEYDDLHQTGVNVVCRATAGPADALIRWRLSATFPETLVLEEVQFPMVTLRASLDEAAAEEAVVIGATKGGVLRGPANLKVGARVTGSQPGNLAAQFGCYYGPRAGFYTAAYDGVGTPKRVAFARSAEGLVASWTHCCFGASPFALDYDLITTTFAGPDAQTPTDWRDAADLYRAWAVTQPWCARTLAQRRDLPAWLLAGPAMVRFNRAWLADSATIRRWLTDYWGKHFPQAPLITAYWGWEKIETWVTPDYFPVFPSDEVFQDLVAWSRQRGCHAFLWPSGYHWTLTYDKQPDGNFRWDDRQRFAQVAAAHAVVTRDGKVYSGDRSWLRGGATSCLCPGDPWTINWWNQDVAAPIARRGGEIIQSDQVVGGNFPWCYSTTHGHPPGPGPWMTEAFARQLQTEVAQCRKLQRDLVVCFEEPNERFNHLVAVQDYRDCETPYEWASVFNYLYHDYLPTFQSNPRADDVLMTAYCFANGQMPHWVPSMLIGSGPLLVNGEFEKTAGDVFPGWSQVKEYGGRVWAGTWTCDPQEKHSGMAGLRLDNVAETDVVQVSQNVSVGGPSRHRAHLSPQRLDEDRPRAPRWRHRRLGAHARPEGHRWLSPALSSPRGGLDARVRRPDHRARRDRGANHDPPGRARAGVG